MVCCLSGAAQTSPLTAIARGKQAFDAGDYTQALRSFEEARKISSNCAIPFFIGLAHYRLKQIDQAIMEFSSASACDPSMVDAKIAVAEAYAEKGDDNRALAAYQAVLKLQPDNVEALRASGKLCLHHEMNTQAIPLFKRLVQLQPADLQAKSDLAAAYAATGKFQQAEEELNKALQADPANPSAVAGLGAVYLRSNRTQQALPLLQKAVRLAPNDAQPFYLLGSAYNRIGKYQDALAQLDKARQKSPNDPDIYYQIARACEHLGRSKNRQAAMARFAELKGESEKAFEARREAMKLLIQAKPFVDAGKLQEALKLVGKARQLDPDNDQVLYRLASLYFDTRQDALARQTIFEAIAIAPSEWSYHYLAGLIEERTRQFAAARESLEMAAQLNPTSAEAYDELGNVALQMNNPKQAVQDFKRAVALDPHKAGYKLKLEAAYRAAGQKF